MTHLQRIKNEYQEPFRDTIKAFAIQGHSRRGVAKILEVNQSYMLTLIKAYGCDKYFRAYKDMRPETKNMFGRKGRHGNTEPIHRAFE